MLSTFFSCYLWWLLAGALLGWLANWLLCKCCGSNKSTGTTVNSTMNSTNSTVNTATHAGSNLMGKVGAAGTGLAGAAGGVVNSATNAGANVGAKLASAVPAAAATVAAVAAPVMAKVAADPVLDTNAAKLAGFSVKGMDDLEVIEGIGPKICGLFHAAGFKTFTQVSHMTIQQMAKILDDAGPRFKLANPETWAQQAGLAANNRWTELKTMQDNLTAGVTLQQDRSEL
jgi:predicted flap endonuclease-1-like 5' DNA nuclease